MNKRQQVLVLYLKNSALDSQVLGWANYDGTGNSSPYAGDSSEPPYAKSVDALKDGWRLFQASPLAAHVPGTELTTSYLKFEFLFEKLESIA